MYLLNAEHAQINYDVYKYAFDWIPGRLVFSLTSRFVKTKAINTMHNDAFA